MRIPRIELTDRQRTGWALGHWAFGRERRSYRLTVTVTLAWPLLWRHRDPAPLAPAPVFDEQAFHARHQPCPLSDAEDASQP